MAGPLIDDNTVWVFSMLKAVLLPIIVESTSLVASCLNILKDV